jgi:hypothetical protein
MIEKYGGSKSLLTRADLVIEQQLKRLRGTPLPAKSGATLRSVRRRRSP